MVFPRGMHRSHRSPGLGLGRPQLCRIDRVADVAAVLVGLASRREHLAIRQRRQAEKTPRECHGWGLLPTRRGLRHIEHKRCIEADSTAPWILQND